MPINVAKTLSFLAGMVFAYFVNRAYTFEAHGQSNRYVTFIALYLSTLAVNVGVNALVLYVIDFGKHIDLALAFVIATGCSATLNFIGMKFFVFNQKQT